MERLSVASALATGHELTVFSDDPKKLRCEALGVPIEDAREVLDDAALGGLKAKKPDHFSDLFRAEGLAKQLGPWVDLDLLFVRQLPHDDFLLAWQEQGIVCNAVLMMPPQSAILAEYLSILRKRPISVVPSWLPFWKRLALHAKHTEQRLRGRRGLSFPYGPPALTHLVAKHGIEQQVRAEESFYPVHWSKIAGLYSDDIYRPASGTHAIHLWRNYCVRWLGSPKPAIGSYLWRAASDLGVIQN